MRVDGLVVQGHRTMSQLDPPNPQTTMIARNVSGTDLLTGFYRDGCCHTDAQEHGTHVVCARMTREKVGLTQLQALGQVDTPP